MARGGGQEEGGREDRVSTGGDVAMQKGDLLLGPSLSVQPKTVFQLRDKQKLLN